MLSPKPLARILSRNELQIKKINFLFQQWGPGACPINSWLELISRNELKIKK
jgi:hypothetical protein